VTDHKSQSDPQTQEQPVERRPDAQDPTAVDHVRESNATTISNGGLGGGRPQGGARVTPERARTEGDDRNPVMPDEDATLRTEI
jgi:hypothetical protein